MIYYSDEFIKIRDLCQEDVVSLFSWWIDKEINRFDPRPLPRNSRALVEECVNYCRTFDIEKINENLEERKYRYFMVTNRDDLLLGLVNFFSIDKVKRQGEMGITIGDKRYWNKGIGSRAANAVINYIFNNMSIDRIYIETAENNKPSVRLFQKLGFQKCGEYWETDDFKIIVMEKRRVKDD